jgi:predicted ATP-dependent Lon-type protease
MERLNVFIDKEKIDKLFNEEKYKNCMEKKYFEYVVSNGKIDYIDKYLKDSKNRKIIESLVFKNKVVTIIDRLSVRLEDKRYIGELENSGIDDIEISKELIDNYHNQILTKGIFSLIKLVNYEKNIFR